MTLEFSLDRKRAGILVACVAAVIALVFLAGWISGLMQAGEKRLALVKATPAARAKKTTSADAGRHKVVRRKIPPQPAPKPPAEKSKTESSDAGDANSGAGPSAPPSPPEKAAEQKPLYSVQVAAFRKESDARKVAASLRRKGYKPYVFPKTGSRGRLWYTVRIGDFAGVTPARATAAEFTRKQKKPAVVVLFGSLKPLGQHLKPSRDAETAEAKTGGDDKPAKQATAVHGGSAGPYVLQLGCYRKIQSLENAVSGFRASGLSPFSATTEIPSRGIWHRLYIGPFRDRSEAAAAKRRYHISEAVLVEAPWANLAGEFTDKGKMEAERNRLASKGLRPYVVGTDDNGWRLFLGAYKEKGAAESARDRLEKKGVETRTVKR